MFCNVGATPSEDERKGVNNTLGVQVLLRLPKKLIVPIL